MDAALRGLRWPFYSLFRRTSGSLSFFFARYSYSQQNDSNMPNQISVFCPHTVSADTANRTQTPIDSCSRAKCIDMTPRPRYRTKFRLFGPPGTPRLWRPLVQDTDQWCLFIRRIQRYLMLPRRNECSLRKVVLGSQVCIIKRWFITSVCCLIRLARHTDAPKALNWASFLLRVCLLRFPQVAMRIAPKRSRKNKTVKDRVFAGQDRVFVR